MYGRIILFILVAFYQLSAISGEFLQVYYHNGEFKEDLKIYGTGLVKLSTSSFESTCGNKGGDFSKRFPTKKIKEIFNIVKKSAEIHKHKINNPFYTIVYKTNKVTKYIDPEKNDQLLSKLNLALAFIKKDLTPQSVIQISGKKLGEKKIEVEIKNIGQENIKVALPMNMNQLFFVKGDNQYIESFQSSVTLTGQRIILNLHESISKDMDNINMNTSLISKYSATPFLNLCSKI